MNQTIIEYLKVVLTGPTISGLVIAGILWLFHNELRDFIKRLGHIKFPGGELDAPFQSQASIAEEASESVALINGASPTNINDTDLTEVLKSAQEAALLWEFRFLNYFLVRRTQDIFSWFVTHGDPISQSLFDATWNLLIGTQVERDAIINSLSTHRLITIDETHHFINVTDKGRNYAYWPGRSNLGYQVGVFVQLALPRP